MPRPIMTLLADVRNLLHQQLVMVASMGAVTSQTVLFHWRVLIHVRASLFSVTFITEIIDRVGLQVLITERSMGVVTVGAGNLPFLNWMVRLSIRFRPDVLMTRKTEFVLRLF